MQSRSSSCWVRSASAINPEIRMSRLLESFEFPNGCTSPNRLWLAPMTNMQSHPDGSLSDAELAWLEMRAAGGFGVIESCATHVSLDGQGWQGEWGVFDDAHVPDWQRAAATMHGHGSLLLAQLYHGGARALRTDGRQPWSASTQGDTDSTFIAEGTEEQLVNTIAAFADGAARVAAAGGDGIELHAAHGYLLSQFLSTDFNRRQDSWGGSLENRSRLVLECLRAVRQRVPASFIVGVRLSPENWSQLKGLDLDENVQVAQWLCESGADFIHLSLWDASKNTSKRPEQHAARVFRDALPSRVPIITAGNLWTRDDAEAQLDHGATAVAIGRAAITTPDWPHRVARDGGLALRPPVTSQQLLDRALSPSFVKYMDRWPGFVLDPPAP